MSVLTTKLFWLDTIERAVKTIAQTAVGLLTADNLLGILNVNWESILSVSALTGLVSILTSVGSAGTGNSASLVVDAKKKDK